MKRAIEALIDEDGRVRFLEPVELESEQGVLVILDQAPAVSEATLLSEPRLAADWERHEEEAAWSHVRESCSPPRRLSPSQRPGV